MTEYFSPDELAEFSAYAAPRYICGALGDALYLLILLGTVWGLVGPMFWLSQRWASALAHKLRPLSQLAGLRVVVRAVGRLWGESGWGAALVFAVLLYVWLTALFLPFDVYLDYVHEHQFGLSRYTPAHFAWDTAKGMLWVLVPVVATAFGMFGLARRTPHWWWLLGLVGGVLMLGSTALDPYRSRVFYEQTSLSPGPLRNELSQLTKRAQIDVRDILVENTSRTSVKVQAYFAGVGPTRTIVLNDTLVEKLTEAEVAAAVAHEAGHVHQPRWPGRVGAALGLLGFLFLVEALFRAAARWKWWGVERRADIRLLPAVILAFFLLSSLIRPVSAALSRERELEADRYALQLTGDARTFRSMLVKATRINKMDPQPPTWVVVRGSFHPPVYQRLEQVAAWEKNNGDR